MSIMTVQASKSRQLFPTLWDPIDCRLPGFSVLQYLPQFAQTYVHGILQARILEWVAISFSRESFPLKNQTRVSCIAGRFFTDWAT